MFDWFEKLDIKIQVVIISSITSILVFAFGWVIRIIYERNSLRYKLRKEFEFEQKKKLKEDIAKNKVPLLNAVEELNHRLWNFSQNISEDWHNIAEIDWFKIEKYYINSFVYRFLVFIHWVIKTDKDTISVDSTIADANDILFLKYVKTFKDIFTDADLILSLGYDRRHDTNHFFKNDLVGYSKWVTNNEVVLDFDDFRKKSEGNHQEIKKVVEYFTKIENKDIDKNFNVLMCTHLLTINFLNTFGHDYQKTPKEKIIKITKAYKARIKILEEFEEFIEKSKLKEEMKSILNRLKE